MPNGIEGRGKPLIPRTRWSDAEPCWVRFLKWWQEVSDSIVGIDVSKDTLDANRVRGQRRQARTFENNPDGWKRLLAWLKALGSQPAHVCMEATGRYSLGIALALHDAGHLVSVVNPAKIRDFTRSKLGRNKTGKADAALIRDYATLFSPNTVHLSTRLAAA
jgi:transposase